MKLPETVNVIEESAFESCASLNDFVLPAGVTRITKACFQAAGLRNFTLPSTVTHIDDFAFRSSDITNLFIHKGIKEMGKSVFANCRELKKVSFEEGVKTLGIRMFQGSYHLKDITLPESLTEIPDDALANIGIETIVIPKNVKTIGKGAFYECRNLKRLVIPNTVAYVDSFAFAYCLDLEYIRYPEGIKTLKYCTLFGCNYLVDFQIPKSVTEIEDYALGACERLTSITIPRGVTKIGSLAFRDWFVMKTLYCEAEVPPVCADDTFQGANVSNCKLYVPEKSVEAYKKANIWKDFSVIGKIALGIDSINNETATEERVDVYTIDGLRVLQRATQSEVGELPKGIYIIKGKKVIIK